MIYNARMVILVDFEQGNNELTIRNIEDATISDVEFFNDSFDMVIQEVTNTHNKSEEDYVRRMILSSDAKPVPYNK